ncbi:MAG: methyltransferase family protein [Bdellovibrio sp.]
MNPNNLNYALFILSFVLYCSFCLSVFIVFKKPQKQDLVWYNLLRALSLVYWIRSLYLYWVLEYHIKYSYFAISFFIIAIIFFWINSNLVKKNGFEIVFTDSAPSKITVSGTYKFVRHPFYTLYCLVYLASAAYQMDALLIVLATILTTFYVLAARREEKQIMASSLKEEYIKYKSKTGAFFPLLVKNKRNI